MPKSCSPDGKKLAFFNLPFPILAPQPPSRNIAQYHSSQCNTTCPIPTERRRSRNILTHHLLPTSRTLDRDIPQLDALAQGAGTARQIRHHIPSQAAARPPHILKHDVADVDPAGELPTRRRIPVKVALIQHNRRVRVLNVDVPIRYVAHVSVAHIGSRPGFQPRPVLAVKEGDVFEKGVGDVVHFARVLAYAAHGDAVGAVAPEVRDVDVCRVWFRGEAVVADVDAGVEDGEARDVEGVEAVGVFGEGGDVG